MSKSEEIKAYKAVNDSTVIKKFLREDEKMPEGWFRNADSALANYVPEEVKAPPVVSDDGEAIVVRKVGRPKKAE